MNNSNSVHELDTKMFEAEIAPVSMKENIKKMFKNIASSKKFDGLSIPFAYESYLISKYGKLQDNNQRVDEFMASLGEKIKAAHGSKKFHILTEIPSDIIEFKSVILKFFTDKGYTAEDLSDRIPNLSTNFIFIAWDNFLKSQEMIEMINFQNEDKTETEN